jgi:hypothetical protein
MVGGEMRVSMKGWAGILAAVTAIGVVLGVLGPFGSFFNGPLWQRVGYWTLCVWVGSVVLGGGGFLILRRLGSRPAGWAVLALFALAASGPLALLNWRIATGLWPHLRGLPNLGPELWYRQGLVITAPQLVLLAAMRSRAERRRPAAPQVEAPAQELRLPPGEILCLQMEDHYVRAHTVQGSRLALMTLGEAMAGLGGAPGLRVHRSWWVARRAVAGAEMDGRNLRLLLLNGLKVPVARSAVAAVRAAGWLDRAPATAPAV